MASEKMKIRIAFLSAIITLVSFLYKLSLGIITTSMVLIIASFSTLMVFVCKILYAKFLEYRVKAADGFTFDYKNYDYPALVQIVASSRSSMALSNSLICDSKAFIELMDIESTWFTESFTVLGNR